MAEQTSTATMSVTQVSPVLMVIADGATVAAPADRTDGTVVVVGDRVQVSVRTPQVPLVTGKVVPPTEEP